MTTFPTLAPMGDEALVVTFGEQASPAITAQVRAFDRLLATSRLTGVTDVVPAYVSVTLHYVPSAFIAEDRSPYEVLTAGVQTRLAGLTAVPAAPGREITIPVCYGGEHGPDLEAVALQHGLTSEAVITLHTGPAYPVHMLGFAPGFPYLGGLDPQLATPRRATPRIRIPAGSVGIGGAQTGIYPLESPGGWNLIGRTPLILFSLQNKPPALLQPGDTVRFIAITPEEFARRAGGRP